MTCSPARLRQSGDEPSDSIDELDDRLAGIEDAQRLNVIEDRISDLEEDLNHGGDSNDSIREGEGQKALRLALAAFLNNENMTKAASELVTTLGSTIKEWAGLKTKELQNHKAITLGTYFGGLGFSAFLLLILTALLWHDKITKELAAGLLGSLIGYSPASACMAYSITRSCNDGAKSINGKSVSETFSSAVDLRKAQREVEAFHRFRLLSQELLEVNEKICRARPAADTLSPEEKKRRMPSSRKSRAK